MRNVKIKPRNVPEEGTRARVTGSSVCGLLFPLPQACVTGRRSKHEGELITSEWNTRVRRRQWRVAIGGIGSDEGRENANRDEMRQNGPRLPGNTHKRRGNMGQFACLSARPAQGIYMNPSPQRYNVRYTEREGGKRKRKSKEFLPATERAALYAKSIRYSD